MLDVRLDAVDYASATRTIIDWAHDLAPKYVCHANVHMLMEAHDDPSFAAVVNRADMVTADGVPLVWAMRAKGSPTQTRVYGPTLMLHVLAAAETAGLPVAFYGSTQRTMDMLTVHMAERFPRLQVAFARSPPFSSTGPGSPEDDEQLRASGAALTFVGLGCPKQERWMATRVGRVPGVLLGVGAAFDFHARTVKQAPPLVQQMGLEWAFRLATEPRRLLLRYAKHNPRFVALMLRELLGERMGGPRG